jgi:NAD(P)H-nitrite reductase large subunit
MKAVTQDTEDHTVCFCHNVPRSELIAAIRAGAITLSQIQEQTLASTGCGGCECEVTEILEAELRELKAAELAVLGPAKASGE